MHRIYEIEYKLCPSINEVERGNTYSGNIYTLISFDTLSIIIKASKN